MYRAALTLMALGALLGIADGALVMASGLHVFSAWLVVGTAVALGVGWVLVLGLGVYAPARLVGVRAYSALAAAMAVVASLWVLTLLADDEGNGMAWLLAPLVAVVGAHAAWTGGRLALRAPRALMAIVAVVAALPLAATPAFLVRLVLASARGESGPCTDAPVADRPNLVLVSVDTLRADQAGTMKSYARLRAAGSEYRQHVAPSPWTLPSMATLLSGLPPDAHGAGRRVSPFELQAVTPLRPELPRLARRLGERGYRTHAIVTNPFLTPAFGVAEGFCTFENRSLLPELLFALRGIAPIRAAVALGVAMPSDRADRIVDEAERWLAAHDGAPFFLWVHLLDPHAPYGDVEGRWSSITADLQQRAASHEVAAPFGAMVRLRAGEYRPDADQRARIRALYDGDVAFADAQIERLLDVLAARGLAERTVVALTSDHGEEFWDHGGVEHGHTLYEEVLRVPLVIAGPGVAPRSVATLTTAVDVPATLLALAGAPARDLPGRDLRAVDVGDAAPVRLGVLLFGQEWAGVRAASTKYARAQFGEERLFDLPSDPLERRNVAAADPEQTAALRALLPADLFAPPAAATGVAPQAPAGLRALGYVE